MEKEIIKFLYDNINMFDNFFNNIIKQINTNKVVDNKLLLSIFVKQTLIEIFKTVTNTYEYKLNKDYIKSLSLIIYTEKNESDYSISEKEFFNIVLKVLRLKYKNIDYHKNTKLFLNLN